MSSRSNRAQRYDVVVIGAGHNGLTTAAFLARAGRKVVVVERRETVGGIAAGEEFHPGYSSAGLVHDTTGVRPGVVDTLRLASFGLQMTAEPPPVFAPAMTGPGLLLHHDPAAAGGEIAAHSEADVSQYAAYRAFFQRIEGLARRMFDAAPPDVLADGRLDWREMLSTGWALRRLGRTGMMEVLRLGPMCVADWLNEWFESNLLKCLLAGPALYGTFTGPWSPGSNALLVRYESLCGQSVRTGPAGLIRALAAAALALGAEIRTEADVMRIRVSGGSAMGVTLSDGEEIDAPIVAASCDPKRTLLQLLGRGDIGAALEHRIEGYRTNGTTAKVNLALAGPLRFACRPDLTVEFARIGETLDGMERAFDAVKYGRFSEAPVLDVYVPTVSNSELAPAGHSVVSIMVHFAPYGLTGGWTDERREALGDTVVAVLAQYAPGVSDLIIGREVLTPVDIESRYSVTGGHWHHGEHGLDQLLVRPVPECARYATPVGGLYLCGSGSHPGGGLTCGPGSLAAGRILGDNGGA